MTNLSKRVQISKKLVIKRVLSPGSSKIVYSTSTHDNEHHYQMMLEKTREVSPFGDKQISHDTITVQCIACHQPVGNCPGNSYHTICKHGLGAIRRHMSVNNCTIAICKDIFDAVKLRKPGQSLVKIVSGQGKATLWGVVTVKQIRAVDESSLLKSELTKEHSADIHFNTPAPNDILQERINLLRGPANEQNGID